MREVRDKRRGLRKRGIKRIGRFLEDYLIPVILGPNNYHYIIDHHHLALALLREGAGNVLVTVIADLSMLEPEQLWAVLDHHSRVYPYDEDGRRVDVADIAKRVEQLKDDPFRSLAGELQRTGGCAKDMTPFSEFLWTDFLRRRLGRRRVEKNFSVAAPGNEIGQDANARYLPGWCGPADRRPPNG